MNIGNIIQNVFIIALFIFFIYARIEGHYTSEYIAYNECGNDIAFEKISKNEWNNRMEAYNPAQDGNNDLNELNKIFNMSESLKSATNSPP